MRCAQLSFKDASSGPVPGLHKRTNSVTSATTGSAVIGAISTARANLDSSSASTSTKKTHVRSASSDSVPDLSSDQSGQCSRSLHLIRVVMFQLVDEEGSEGNDDDTQPGKARGLTLRLGVLQKQQARVRSLSIDCDAYIPSKPPKSIASS